MQDREKEASKEHDHNSRKKDEIGYSGKVIYWFCCFTENRRPVDPYVRGTSDVVNNGYG